MLFFRLAEKKVVKINPSSTASEVWGCLCLDNYLTAKFGFLNSCACAEQSKNVFLNLTYLFTLKTRGLYQVQLFFQGLQLIFQQLYFWSTIFFWNRDYRREQNVSASLHLLKARRLCALPGSNSPSLFTFTACVYSTCVSSQSVLNNY